MEEGDEFDDSGGVPSEPWDLADSCVKLGGEGREVGIRGGRGEEVGENAEKTLRNRSSIPGKKNESLSRESLRR